MDRFEILEYYARDDVAGEIAKNAASREVAAAHVDGSYEPRPNALQYPSDVLHFAKRGVTSFHYSVEHWLNPMALTKENYASLRSGWDIILDIDSKLGVEEAKLAAAAIITFIEKYGVKNYGVKFSGRRGFHIALPWVMFPTEINSQQTRELYPEAPRAVAGFICERIRIGLMRELIKIRGMKNLQSSIDESMSKMNPFLFVGVNSANFNAEKVTQEGWEIIDSTMSPYSSVEVERNWGNRHMFRAPYSLNEKTWLVSMPIKRSDFPSFRAENAKPGNVKIVEFFSGEENEAERLLIDALDWAAERKKEPAPKPAIKRAYTDRIPEEMFPPCMRLILAGLRDGRKRSVFTLINFLRMCNWTWDEITARLYEWNRINPLPESFLLSQIRWSQRNSRTAPNCDNAQYYRDVGICQPDATCNGGTGAITVKNPINYVFRKMKPKTQNKPVEAVYSCSKCKDVFASMKGLNIHLSRTHGIVDL